MVFKNCRLIGCQLIGPGRPGDIECDSRLICFDHADFDRLTSGWQRDPRVDVAATRRTEITCCLWARLQKTLARIHHSAGAENAQRSGNRQASSWSQTDARYQGTSSRRTAERGIHACETTTRAD